MDIFDLPNMLKFYKKTNPLNSFHFTQCNNKTTTHQTMKVLLPSKTLA